LVSIAWGVFIFAGAITVDGIVSAHVKDISPEYSGGGMFEVAHIYVQKVICISSATTIKLEGLKAAAQYLAAIKGRFYASLYGWGMSFPIFPGFDVIERATDLILMFISPFTASLIVQAVGLQIIHATALTLVLPAGILLRVFTPTRDAGSFLIATALGFYFIFPFTYLINARVMYQLYQQEFGYGMCSGKDAIGEDYMLRKGAFYDSLSLKMLPSIKEDFIGIGGFTTSLSYIAFQAVFLPAMTMVFVVTFVKAAMKFFSQKME